MKDKGLDRSVLAPRGASRHVATLLLFTLTACHSSRFAAVDGELQLTPSALSFSDTFVGTTKSQTLTLHNRGAAPLVLHASLDEGPFTVEQTELMVGGGLEAALTVHFAPISLGAAKATLTVAGHSVAIDGTGVEAPVCAAGPCEAARVDAEQGCVVAQLPDDSPCDDVNACVSAGVCRSGVCMASQTACDDHDACTVDLCSHGCSHAPTRCPGSTDPCLVPTCDSMTGCGLAPAADGASCGENDCVTAHVCLAGACVQRAAPEGSSCGTTSLCQSQGQCHQQTCEPGAPLELWRYTAPAGFAVGGIVFDNDGNSYLSLGTNQYPYDGGYDRARLVSLTATGAVRFDVDLSAASPELETVTTLMVDDATGRVLLSARSWRTHLEANRVVVAQARDATGGGLLWERDLKAIVLTVDPSLNSSAASAGLLLNDGSFGVSIENSIATEPSHLAVTVAFNQAGAELWRLSRGGHYSGEAVTSDGSLLQQWAACWSADYRHSRFHDGLETAGTDQFKTTVAVVDNADVIWEPDGGLTLKDPTSGSKSLALPLGAVAANEQYSGYLYAPIARGRADTLTVSALIDGGVAIVRLDTARNMPTWAAPLRSQWLRDLTLLENGGVLAQYVGVDAGSASSVISSQGALVEECPTVGVLNGEKLYHAEGNVLRVTAAPGLTVARSGWVTEHGSPAGTNRAR